MEFWVNFISDSFASYTNTCVEQVPAHNCKSLLLYILMGDQAPPILPNYTPEFYSLPVFCLPPINEIAPYTPLYNINLSTTCMSKGLYNIYSNCNRSRVSIETCLHCKPGSVQIVKNTSPYLLCWNVATLLEAWSAWLERLIMNWKPQLLLE